MCYHPYLFLFHNKIKKLSCVSKKSKGDNSIVAMRYHPYVSLFHNKNFEKSFKPVQHVKNKSYNSL